MIGFYDYTVVLTYISFTSSIIGIFCAVTGHPKWAVFCLALSGLCDMFDGKIARTKKNRTEDEKQFGIQIDSLCDVVCFGVFPIVLCYELGMRRIYSMAILVLYGLGDQRKSKILSGTSNHIHVSRTAAALCSIADTSGISLVSVCTAYYSGSGRYLVCGRF